MLIVMKRAILVYLFMVLSTAAFAQELKPEVNSNNATWKLEGAKGKAAKIERFTERRLSNMNSVLFIYASMYTDLRTGSKEPYILVKIYQEGAYYSGVIDYDELPACLETLKHIINNEVTVSPGHYVDVVFTSRDEVAIGAIYDTSLSNVTWQSTVTLYNYPSRPSLRLPVKRLSEIVRILQSAQELLTEKME